MFRIMKTIITITRISSNKNDIQNIGGRVQSLDGSEKFVDGVV